MAVILNTSLGDLVIDLHTDLCPLTSKNFLKLCKLKYYNNCIFHDVKKDFIAQTGDPTGTGSGGDSIYKHLYGDQARFFNDEFHPTLTHEKIGTVAMASAGENLNASQFYITLRAGLDYLDGKHTVFGEVAEGLDALVRISEAYVDDKGRPYKNIRIKHVDVIDDPFDDPPQLAELIPDRSPEIQAHAEGEVVRLEDDWVPLDEQMDPDELDKSIRRKEAHSRAVVLEMIGDIPEADAAPPENVLFVCKLNPVTEDDDLKTIFSRFGNVVAADIIRDYKTGDSLCYGFIEFENKESCEAAYFKMDNVLIDDRRIHVDFSQSVSKLWGRFRRFGAKDSNGQGPSVGPVQGKGSGCFNCGEYGHLKKDCPNVKSSGATPGATQSERPKYALKDTTGQRGNPGEKYDMVFEKSGGSPRDWSEHTSEDTERGNARQNHGMALGKKEGSLHDKPKQSSNDNIGRRRSHPERYDREFQNTGRGYDRESDKRERSGRQFERREGSRRERHDREFEKREGSPRLRYDRESEKRKKSPRERSDREFERREGSRRERNDREFEKREGSPRERHDRASEKRKRSSRETFDRELERREGSRRERHDGEFEKREGTHTSRRVDDATRDSRNSHFKLGRKHSRDVSRSP